MTVSSILPFIALTAIAAGQPALAQQAEMPASTPHIAIDGNAPSLDEELAIARRAAIADDPQGALEHYLHALARDADSLDALTGAGKAALAIGDPNAAINFLARAERLSPLDGWIKAGLASAMVQLAQPQAALKLFDDALRLGVPIAGIASDRGLAWDLRGDGKRARADYELALRQSPDDETMRRLALSLAISGDPLGALATLDPLLRKQDRAAWRARAFALAINGDVKGAEETARAALQPMQADYLRPFLTRIAKLRPNQKAAAVHFGIFPSDGRSYSEAELLAAAGMNKAEPQPAASPPARSDEPSGPLADENGDDVDIDKIVRQASETYDAQRAARARQALVPVQATQPSNRKEASKPATEAQPSAPRGTAKTLPTSKAEPTKSPKAQKTDKSDGASKEAKNPARHWVQIATGAYKPDLDKEWERLKVKHGALLSEHSPSTTPINRTNRLLIGPFKSADAAQAFVNKAARAGFATSRFTSAEGQSVEAVK